MNLVNKDIYPNLDSYKILTNRQTMTLNSRKNRFSRVPLCLACSLLIAGCASTPAEPTVALLLTPQPVSDAQCRARPDYQQYGIKKIAVLKFGDAEIGETTQFVPAKRFGLRPYDNQIYLKDSGSEASVSAERHLLESYQYQVVDRRNLESVLEEQKRSVSGIIDSASAREVGQLSGADAVMSGDVRDAHAEFTKNIQGDSFIGSYIAHVTLDIRLVDVRSGDILLACTARRNSLNYLDKPMRVSNLDIIRDLHLLVGPLHGSTAEDRVRYVLNQAIRETLADIL